MRRLLSKLSVILCLALGGCPQALAAVVCAHFVCPPAAPTAAAPHASHTSASETTNEARAASRPASGAAVLSHAAHGAGGASRVETEVIETRADARARHCGAGAGTGRRQHAGQQHADQRHVGQQHVVQQHIGQQHAVRRPDGGAGGEVHSSKVRAGAAGEAGRLDSAPADCRHCAGRPEPSRTAPAERCADGPRRAQQSAPPAAPPVVAAPRPASRPAPHLAPTQHAPPRGVPQYLLVSAFLI